MRASAEARKMALLTILALIEGRRKGKQKEFNREVETKTAVEISKTIQNNRRCRVKLDQDAPMQNSPAWSVVELTNSQVNQHVAGVAWGFSSSLPFQQRRNSWFVSGEVIPNSGFQTESSLQFAEVSYCLIGLLFSEQVWMTSTSLRNHWSLWFQFQEKDDVRFDTIRLIVNKIYAPTSPMRFALRNSQLALVGRQYAHRTRACARNETACSERWW